MCTVVSPVRTCSNCGHSLTRPDIEIPTSPLQHLLHSNQYAEGPQISMIHGAITLPLLHISTLDDEISRQKAVLAELRCKREGMAAYVTAHRGLLAPFRSAPDDILVEIFMHFKAEWGRNVECSVKRGPLAIAGVCRRWRDVALRTPPLWSSIPIFFHSCDCPEDWNQLRVMVETWLKRARSCPLSISINGGTDLEFFLDETRLARAAKEMIAVLLKSAVHWRNLYLDFRALEEHLAPIILPNLQHLSLQNITPPASDGFHIFQTAPRLYSLALSGYVGASRDALRFLLPAQWEQLRILDCGKQETGNHTQMWMFECVAILSLTPNLHTARLYVSRSIDQTADIRVRSVHLTKLRSLDITCEVTMPCDPSVLLDSLCTPALASFKIAVADPRHGRGQPIFLPNCAPALAAFVSQCSALCELAIASRLWDTRSEQTPNAFFEILQNTPKLRRLELGSCRRETLNTDFLDVFAGSDSVTPSTMTFLPALTSLTLEDTGGPGVDIAALINALRSRAPRGLRNVTILGQRSRQWPLDFKDWEGEHFTGGSTLGLQDEDIIGRLRQLRDQVANLTVLVEGRNVL